VQRLDSANFVWNSSENFWEQRFEELLAFKEAQGHCNVPLAYKPNPALGTWVGNMRRIRRTGKLAADRERRHEGVGFVWVSKNDGGSSSLLCPLVESTSPRRLCDAAVDTKEVEVEEEERPPQEERQRQDAYDAQDSRAHDGSCSAWQTFRNPQTEEKWFWNEESEDHFSEYSSPGEWRRFVDADGERWWWQEASGEWFYES